MADQIKIRSDTSFRSEFEKGLRGQVKREHKKQFASTQCDRTQTGDCIDLLLKKHFPWTEAQIESGFNHMRRLSREVDAFLQNREDLTLRLTRAFATLLNAKSFSF